MRRIFTIVLAASIVVAGSALPSQAEGTGPCSGWFSNIRPVMGQVKVEDHVKHLLICAEHKWPVEGGIDKVFAIVDRESSFWPWAQNPGSLLCSGLFQDVLSLWPGRVATYWNHDWFWRTPSVFNARANAIVNIRMIHNGGWGPWGA
jgi:hypothetical protein